MSEADSPPRAPKRFLHVVSPTPAECREIRRQLGWTRERLARAAGLTHRAILDYESGLRTPREGTLIAVRRALRAAGIAPPTPQALPDREPTDA
jgi:transcriptional regulator with XRE-family HTH domain